MLLFDVDAKTRVYDITGSKVYTVNTLDIDISQVMPMEMKIRSNHKCYLYVTPNVQPVKRLKMAG